MNLIKYYQIKIFTRIDFTDIRLLELMEKKPTPKEYSDAIQLINISSNNSQHILEFIANYDNGFLLPEKCDAYEPIREKFDPHNLSAPISWLSQPGSAVYLKKIKPFKYEGVIENQRFAPIWEDGSKFLTPKVKEPNHLGYIWLQIDENILKLKSQDYFFVFFNDLFNAIIGEYGYITNPENNTLLEKGQLRAED
jgi:hypothetical protein